MQPQMVGQGLQAGPARYAGTGMGLPEMYGHPAELDGCLYRERGLHITALRRPEGFGWRMYDEPETRRSAIEKTAKKQTEADWKMKRKKRRAGTAAGKPARRPGTAKTPPDGQERGRKPLVAAGIQADADGRAEGPQRNGHSGEGEEGKKRSRAAAISLAAAAVLLAALLLLRGCGGGQEGLPPARPEYEEPARYAAPGGAEGQEGRIDLPVLPDFTVTEEERCFPIPYPDNVYDVEFSFVDVESGEERYHTKRVRPGTAALVPAYDFCEEGEHAYRVNVEVYNRDTYERVDSAVALEMSITRE